MFTDMCTYGHRTGMCIYSHKLRATEKLAIYSHKLRDTMHRQALASHRQPKVSPCSIGLLAAGALTRCARKFASADELEHCSPHAPRSAQKKTKAATHKQRPAITIQK